MKTLATIALTLVLTASLLVGCGCTNRNNNDTAPTVLPTNEELWESTEATTRATTESTTAPMTTESTMGATGGMDTTTETGGIMDGGIMEGTTGTTDGTEGALSRRARRMMPGSK